MGSFTCIGYFSPIHGTDGLKSPPKDYAVRIKRLAQGATAGPVLEPGTSGMEVRGSNHSAMTAPLIMRLQLRLIQDLLHIKFKLKDFPICMI